MLLTQVYSVVSDLWSSFWSSHLAHPPSSLIVELDYALGAVALALGTLSCAIWHNTLHCGQNINIGDQRITHVPLSVDLYKRRTQQTLCGEEHLRAQISESVLVVVFVFAVVFGGAAAFATVKREQ